MKEKDVIARSESDAAISCLETDFYFSLTEEAVPAGRFPRAASRPRNDSSLSQTSESGVIARSEATRQSPGGGFSLAASYIDPPIEDSFEK